MAGESERLFVACDLPDDVIGLVTAWQGSELAGRSELRLDRNLHVTLCFLGKVSSSRVPEIVGAISSSVRSPLPATLGPLLFLPARGRKRVLAVSVHDPSGALVRLQGDVSRSLTALGVYESERRDFLPHLTVARYRRPGQPFSLQNVTSAAFGLPRVILYTSHLEQGGAVHTPLASFPTP